jgi:antagonist of KipI
MRIEVEAPGMLTTVQDLGRPGLGIYGVSRAGAADGVALRVGNRLLGNGENAAGLEMTLTGGRYRFPEGAEVALTGARAEGVPMYRVTRLEAGGVLEIGSFLSGARCYLTVRGGLAVRRTAGSASVHVASGLGGRPLRRGDVLPVGEYLGETGRGEVAGELMAYAKVVRVTAGPQAEQFATEEFYGSEYEVSQDSNRMGIRLTGRAIGASGDGEMVTEGVPLGAIQVPPGGQPIVLFSDQQTTGGYPKIANVITADLRHCAQWRPRDRVRFVLVSDAAAQRALRRQEALLEGI